MCNEFGLKSLLAHNPVFKFCHIQSLFMFILFVSNVVIQPITVCSLPKEAIYRTNFQRSTKVYIPTKLSYEARHRQICQGAVSASNERLHGERSYISRVRFDSYEFGELGSYICHWFFRSAQATSRAEEWTDFTESFKGRVMHNGNKLITR